MAIPKKETPGGLDQGFQNPSCSDQGQGSVGKDYASDPSKNKMFSFAVTFFTDYAAKTLSTADMTLEELRTLVLETTASEKAQLPWLKLAVFGDQRTDKNCLRHDANVVTVTGVELDYDAKVMPFEDAVEIIEKAQLQALLYTSANYKAEEPKWRIVLPTSRELPPQEREKLVERVNGLFDGAFADESFVLSQAYYYGAVNGNPEHRAVVTGGDFIDLRNDLAAGARGKMNGEPWDGTPRKPGDNPEADPELVALALAAIPNEDLPWEEWNRIGMAAFAATDGNGLEAFDAWSQKSTKYNAQETRRRWDHYFDSPPDRIGAGTLFMMANKLSPEWDREYWRQYEKRLFTPNDEATKKRQIEWLKKNVWDKAPKASKAKKSKASAKAKNTAERGGIDMEASIAAGHGSASAQQGAAVLVRASDIVMRSKDWLWEGHLLRGAQEISTGVPGLGKSQVQCSLVACVTTKKLWPDGSPGMKEPASVIMITAEDCLDQEVVPRLIAAGADLNKVQFLKCIKTDDKARQFLLSEDLETLKQCLAEIKDVGLITIDPITAFMGGKVDAHKVTEVRSQLGPLKDFAEENNISVSTITHPPKSSSQRAIDQFIGSQAFIAACRIGHLMVGEMDEDGIPTGRVLFTHAKHNASEKKLTLAFKQNVMTVGQDPHTHKPIIAPYVIWDEHSVPITADGAMAAASGREDTDQKKVKDFLRGILASSDPVPYKNIEDEAEQQGFTTKQLKTAKKKLGIISHKDGMDGPWTWQLKF
jgi:hypothetical protein